MTTLRRATTDGIGAKNRAPSEGRSSNNSVVSRKAVSIQFCRRRFLVVDGDVDFDVDVDVGGDVDGDSPCAFGKYSSDFMAAVVAVAVAGGLESSTSTMASPSLFGSVLLLMTPSNTVMNQSNRIESITNNKIMH